MRELIDVAALPGSPWKNGGGTTRTLAVSPAGAGFEDFEWRVSIADIRDSGSFSRFPGVDRTLVLLEGQGLMLHVNNSAFALTAPFQQLAFRGDDMVRSELPGGPVRDFNVMTRRGCAEAKVRIAQPGVGLSGIADSALFYCVRGSYIVEAESGAETTVVEAGWALRMEGAGGRIRCAPRTPDSILIEALVNKTGKERDNR